MAAKITRLPQSASPTIDEVFEEFLAEQRGRLKPRTLSRYEEVLNLLRHHLNGNAYESLSKAEAAIFDRYYNAKGGEHRVASRSSAGCRSNQLATRSSKASSA